MADKINFVKIGISKCVISRMPKIKAQTRFKPIRLVRAIQMPMRVAIKIEKTVHSILINRRSTRHAYDEWFEASPEEALKAVKMAIGRTLAKGIKVKRGWLYTHFGSPDKKADE